MSTPVPYEPPAVTPIETEEPLETAALVQPSQPV